VQWVQLCEAQAGHAPRARGAMPPSAATMHASPESTSGSAALIVPKAGGGKGALIGGLVGAEGTAAAMMAPTYQEQDLPVASRPRPAHQTSPIYPDVARDAGVDGTVLVRALVRPGGDVADVVIAKSIPMLDESAMAAVRKWTFHAAIVGGKAVTCWTTVPVVFTLH